MFSTFTIFEDCIRYYFANNFYYNAINKDGEAFIVYLGTVIAVALEGIMLVIVYFIVSKALRSVISEHTGYVLGKEINSEGEKKQVLAVQEGLAKNFSVLMDLAIVCALADTFASLYGAFYAVEVVRSVKDENDQRPTLLSTHGKERRAFVLHLRSAPQRRFGQPH